MGLQCDGLGARDGAEQMEEHHSLYLASYLTSNLEDISSDA